MGNIMNRGVMVVVVSIAGSLGCGDPIVDQVPASESGTASAADATTGPTTGTGTADPSTTTTANDDGDACVTVVEIGSFTQITELHLGPLQIYDFDVDGLADIVGGYGAIAYQRPDGFELIPSPEPIVPSWGRAGRFDGDDAPDLLFRISDHRLRLHVGGAAEPVVDTLLADVTSLEPRDMDDDSIDDLVVGIDNGGRIEAWRGTQSGVFEQTAVTSWPGLAYGVFAALEPPRIDLVVSDTAELQVFVGDGAGGFTSADSLPVLGIGPADAVRASDRDALTVHWSRGRFETYSGVGLVSRDDRGAFVERSYDLSPRWPIGSVAASDLDGDAELEIVTGVDDPDGVLIEVACPDGEAFVRCGATPIDHTPQWLALVPGPSGWRVAYSTSEDGTWIASMSAEPCD